MNSYTDCMGHTITKDSLDFFRYLANRTIWHVYKTFHKNYDTPINDRTIDYAVIINAVEA